MDLRARVRRHRQVRDAAAVVTAGVRYCKLVSIALSGVECSGVGFDLGRRHVPVRAGRIAKLGDAGVGRLVFRGSRPLSIDVLSLRCA